MPSVFEEVVAALLPSRCYGCASRGASLCARCLVSARAAPAAALPAGVEWSTSCFAYEGAVRELIARAKYRGERAALKLLARHLGEHVANARLAIDLVTWVPASHQRIERSGVDHAAIVARVCAHRLHVPARKCLQREPDTPQTSRDITARRAGPKVHAVRALTGLAVLVVDDVTTTGATLAASARALRAGGARAVLAATLARTPAPGEANRGRSYTSATTPG